jgi:3-methyladenine DNA glycosylase Mpg
MTSEFENNYIWVEPDFFAGTAVEVAPRLIGCVVIHDNRGIETGTVIVEAEAYDETDMASHLDAAAARSRLHPPRSGHAMPQPGLRNRRIR